MANKYPFKNLTPAPAPDSPACVYLIGNVEAGYQKIGLSRDAARRRSAMQTALPFPVSVLAMKRVATRTRARTLEVRLHFVFKDRRCHGEWFRGVSIADFKGAIAAFEKEWMVSRPRLIRRAGTPARLL